MFSKFRPISISLSPNVEPDDIKLVFNLIIRPWLWKKGRAIREIEEEFKKYLGVKYAVSFNSGRSALYAILKALNLEKDAEVLLQTPTCNAAINPILWLKLNPVYVDCDKDSFNMDIGDLKAKITPKTKILMVQHTFGLPAFAKASAGKPANEILGICQKNNLILIEDCAHALGAEFNEQKVGTFGKAAFFSFSRDKIISSVYGGMAVTNDGEIGKELQDLQKEFGACSYFWLFQQLLHPIFLNYIVLPAYNFLDLGKIFLVLFQWFNILPKAVSQKEKQGEKPDYFPKALPNALAMMALNQFKKLDRFYQHRRQLSRFYYKSLKGTKFEVSDDLFDENLAVKNVKHSFLRFSIGHPKAHEIIYQAWHKQNILVGDWYTLPIIPCDTDLAKMRYEQGSCPNAEAVAKTTLNLPTHINISKTDAEKIVNFLMQWS